MADDRDDGHTESTGFNQTMVWIPVIGVLALGTGVFATRGLRRLLQSPAIRQMVSISFFDKMKTRNCPHFPFFTEQK